MQTSRGNTTCISHVIAWIALVGVILADDPTEPIPDDVMRYINFAEPLREDAVRWANGSASTVFGQALQLKETLAQHKKWTVSRSTKKKEAFSTKAAKDRDLESLAEQLEKAELAVAQEHQKALTLQTKAYLTAPAMKRPEKGRFGSINGSIIQIVDDKNMIVRCEWVDSTKSGFPKESATIWVRGFSTKNFADEQQVRIASPFQITGTTKYDSVSGASRTLFVAEPLDVERVTKYYEEYLKRQRETLTKTTKSKTPALTGGVLVP